MSPFDYRVKRAQECLLELGYKLPKWGADGYLGEETAAALKQFQARHNLPPTGQLDHEVWLILDQACASHLDQDYDVVQIYDIRGQHARPHYYSDSRSPRKVITGVTLHQTGVLMTDTPERFRSLNAHVAVLRSGDIVLVNDFRDFIWHAQGLSHHTIGIEFNGHFAGRPDEHWEHEFLTKRMIKAADRLFSLIQDWFATQALEWTDVNAHRQAKNSRRSDPGWEIWRRVALKWIEHLEEQTPSLKGRVDGGPSFHIGSGRPIPKEWNSSYSQNKY